MQTSELGIICNLVEQYCLRMEDTIKQFVNIVRNDYRIEETLDSLHPKPTTSFPSQYHQQQLQVLLFNNDTKQKFLRTALTPELFTNLKKISKLWLANVPEEQRKQATKVAQAIAKAITDGRVECITENDLATYKTRVIERLGREYHIPHEQICLAFTQKIRVYLQNTKSKHNKWIERYGGKVDINAPKIIFPKDESDGEETLLDGDQLNPEHLNISFGGLRETGEQYLPTGVSFPE